MTTSLAATRGKLCRCPATTTGPKVLNDGEPKVLVSTATPGMRQYAWNQQRGSNLANPRSPIQRLTCRSPGNPRHWASKWPFDGKQLQSHSSLVLPKIRVRRAGTGVSPSAPPQGRCLPLPDVAALLARLRQRPGPTLTGCWKYPAHGAARSAWGSVAVPRSPSWPKFATTLANFRRRSVDSARTYARIGNGQHTSI
jgi:hypothetical protein